MVADSEKDACAPAQERRRFSRFGATMPVLTLRDDLCKGGRSRDAAKCRLRMQDFSLGGFKAETEVPLKINEHLTMRLPAHGNHPPLHMTGRVVHCVRREDRYQVGIEFCQTRPEPTASPWHRISRLFSMAFKPTAERPLTEEVDE